ncbi:MULTISPECIES: hypothetical protein [unclassified Trinickia]|jgi:hypothetical protein|uniref:hypothetical protein n=1 Tax=unclassified Trinickia TaxID=2638168 RepID=UPI0024056F52|nr:MULTISPECIES: hypothetical protein [unclassified Trinickia]MDG0024157.1 hypothetical protein [Trinickia sp. Y13]HVW49218.1 hypothetical protein [Trinickia sp.]
MNAFFWWLLNIGVPIAGPVCMLGLFSVTHGKGVARLLIYESLKGGQLLWSAIAISATAIYESATVLERRAGPAPLFELAIAAFLMIAFTCSMLVMLVTLKQHDDRTLAYARRRTQAAWPLSTDLRLPEDATVSTSVWLTGAAALLFGALHMIVS